MLIEKKNTVDLLPADYNPRKDLKPGTNVVEPAPRKQFASGNTMPAWYADAWHLPKEERSRLRSKTFPGIAKALAEQFTQQITGQNDLKLGEVM